MADDEFTFDQMLEQLINNPKTLAIPPDEFNKMGVINRDLFLANLHEGPAKSKRAYNNGSYIEVIALRIQHTELWLRMFLVAMHRQCQLFDENHRLTFGQIIDECEKIGLDAELIGLLSEFNKERNKALHKYLLGATDYGHLKQVCDKFDGLDMKTMECVRPIIRDIYIPQLLNLRNPSKDR